MPDTWLRLLDALQGLPAAAPARWPTEGRRVHRIRDDRDDLDDRDERPEPRQRKRLGRGLWVPEPRTELLEEGARPQSR